MKNQVIAQWTTLAFVALMTLFGSAQAWAKKSGGGNGGSGGPSYRIIDLLGPDHGQNGGWSQTHTDRISNPNGTGAVFVLGRYDIVDNGFDFDFCLWVISSNGAASVFDLSGLMDNPQDLNSAGIVGGQHEGRPAVVLGGGQTIFLSSAAGSVAAMNDPDADGVFQAVGNLWTGQGLPSPIVWDLLTDGTVRATSPITDASGQDFYAQDISNSPFLGGATFDGAEWTPAVAAWDHAGELQIMPLTLPPSASFSGYETFQVDDGGDLVATTYSATNAFVWPTGGTAINLATASGHDNVEGNGVALVNGVMQVVGAAVEPSGTRDRIAYVYTGGRLIDLQPLSRGEATWDLFRADGINTAGIVCAEGRVGSRKNMQYHGCILIPNTP